MIAVFIPSGLAGALALRVTGGGRALVVGVAELREFCDAVKRGELDNLLADVEATTVTGVPLRVGGVLRWEEPTDAKTWSRRPRGPSRTAWSAVVADLRANPGRSGVVLDGAPRNTALTTRINRGQHHRFQPPGAFEATSRHRGDGLYTFYVRYVGEEANRG